MELGEIVKVIDPECSAGLNARVKILQLDHEANTAVIEILFVNKPPITVSLDTLAENTKVQPLSPEAIAKIANKSITHPKATKVSQPAKVNPFDPAYFGETGVKISCRCGHVTRRIHPKLIQSWDNENAAINYVIGLCSYCMTPHQARYNATGSFSHD